jgi:hypothetical protein
MTIPTEAMVLEERILMLEKRKEFYGGVIEDIKDSLKIANYELKQLTIAEKGEEK